MQGRGPRVPRSKGSKVQGSQGPKDQDITNSHSNTSLTLKKVHLVLSYNLFYKEGINDFDFLIITQCSDPNSNYHIYHVILSIMFSIVRDSVAFKNKNPP